MKSKKLLTTLALVSVVLIAGCNKDEFWRNDSNPANSDAIPVQVMTSSPVPLGSAATFAVLGGVENVTNTGTSFITGDLGVSPGTAITGFEPPPVNTIVYGPLGTVTFLEPGGIVSGTIYAGDAVAAQAHNDATKAYQYLIDQPPDTLPYLGVTQLTGRTFTPGVYNFASSANLVAGGTLTLDFQGNSDALFIFQLGSTLVTEHDSKVVAINNGTGTCLGSNVFWAVGSSATIDGAEFIGTVIAYTTITMTTAANIAPLTDPADTINVFGRVIALGGAITMVNENISTCGTSGGGTKPPKPCRDFVTGGGWIKWNSDGHCEKHSKNDKATFGVSGGIINGKFWGQLSYNDHDGVSVKSIRVTGYRVINATTREITGLAKINGRGSFTYTVVVVDNGEPGHKWGHSKDSFSLVLENGYSASGTLDGGNIQLHMKCGDWKPNHHKDKDDGDDDDDDDDDDDSEDYNDKDEYDGHKNCDNNGWRR